jgi:hypothetical protein
MTKPACNYKGHDTAGKPCTRLPVPGWTTCARHYSAGRRKQPRGFRRGTR